MKINVGKLVAWAVAAVFVVAFVGFIGSKVLGPLAVEGGSLVFGMVQISDLVFGAVATLTVAGAAGVALSRNILYSALSLLLALLGAGALYVMLSADFLAVTQLLVYIGGVLVLVLFAVMLTNQISHVNISNKSFGLVGGLVLFLATAPLLVFVAVKSPWATLPAPTMAATTAAIGNAFLTKWLLPFELASLVLLATLIGAVVIARKELKAD
jgi:NADH-quinone oxidoreductase subunit J